MKLRQRTTELGNLRAYPVSRTCNAVKALIRGFTGVDNQEEVTVSVCKVWRKQ